MLNDLFDSITSGPRHVLVLAMFILSLQYSPFIAPVALLMLFISKCPPTWMKWVLAVYALLGATILWIGCGINLHQISQLNQGVLFQLFHAEWTVCQDFYLWLFAAPYGVLLGCLSEKLLTNSDNIKTELRSIAAGAIKKPRQALSKKQLAKHSSNITSSATDTGTVLGIDRYTGNAVELKDQDANLHTFIVGTTGTGKTTTIANIVESAIKRRLPLIYVDGKGDLPFAQRIKAFAAANHVNFELFSMAGESKCYNPISHGGYTSKKDRIIELREWPEDHYLKIAEGYLQTVFKILERVNIVPDLHQLNQHLSPNHLYELTRCLNDRGLFLEI